MIETTASSNTVYHNHVSMVLLWLGHLILIDSAVLIAIAVLRQLKIDLDSWKTIWSSWLHFNYFEQISILGIWHSFMIFLVTYPSRFFTTNRSYFLIFGTITATRSKMMATKHQMTMIKQQYYDTVLQPVARDSRNFWKVFSFSKIIIICIMHRNGIEKKKREK